MTVCEKIEEIRGPLYIVTITLFVHNKQVQRTKLWHADKTNKAQWALAVAPGHLEFPLNSVQLKVAAKLQSSKLINFWSIKQRSQT